MLTFSQNNLHKYISQPLPLAGLLFVFCLIVGYFSFHYHFNTDLTQNQRNSLSKQSQKVLESMPENVYITAYCSNTSNKGKYFRKSINQLINPYKRLKENFIVAFIDPTTQYKQGIKLGLKNEGDMIITYQDTSEFYGLPYNEESFSNKLNQLKAIKKKSFFFTDGHLEHNLHDNSAAGWSKFADLLKTKGITFQQSSDFSALKQQSQVLVIPGAKQTFSNQESNAIDEHIQNGGHMVWLIDSAPPYGLDRITKMLSIDISNGTAVDLTNHQYGIAPEDVDASQYANHASLTDFSLRTIFPSARRIIYKHGTTKSEWVVTPLIGVARNGWLTKNQAKDYSTQALRNNFEKEGPINIALALERKFNEQQQRILILGSSQFLANKTIDFAGNKALGAKLIRWISGSTAYIHMPQQLTKDRVVIIPNNPTSKYLLLGVFNGTQFLLPLILLLTATIAWMRKRKG